MKLFFKNKIISFGGDSDVINEKDEKLFYIDGKVFTFTRKKHIYDELNNYLLSVRRKYWRLFVHTIYVYNKETNKRFISVKQRFFSRKYHIESSIGSFEIESKFLDGIYIRKNGETLAKFYNNRIVDLDILGDEFCIETECQNKDDLALVVGIVAGFDIFKDEFKSNHR